MVLPYLKGFLYILVFIVMVNGLWFILGFIEVYLQIWYRYLVVIFIRNKDGLWRLVLTTVN
jgi:hypothetical protein